MKYIPFQSLQKTKAYRILHYGQPYINYSHFRISSNPEGITDIYVDKEPHIIIDLDGNICEVLDESQITYQVEIHYSPETQIPMKCCILTNAEIDTLVAKWGCKL
jgi:hypothetical protein